MGTLWAEDLEEAHCVNFESGDLFREVCFVIVSFLAVPCHKNILLE